MMPDMGTHNLRKAHIGSGHAGGRGKMLPESRLRQKSLRIATLIEAPNSHLVLRSTHIEKREDGTHSVDFAYIHGSGSLEMRQSLLACLEIGVMVFFVFLLCHREHPNVAELNQRAEEIHGHITAFIKNLGLTEATPGC